MRDKITVFWFRRDLRLEDNIGLYHALSSGLAVLPIFIFDTDILNTLEEKEDRRVDYIHQALAGINLELKSYGTCLNVFHGNPIQVFKTILQRYAVGSLYFNRDYEPQAIIRDLEISELLSSKSILVSSFKDQVIFEKSEVIKKDKTPYRVYTAYANKWKALLTEDAYKSCFPDYTNFFQQAFVPIPPIEEFGFKKTDILFESPSLEESIIAKYDKQRDYPAIQGTTELGMPLRFGSISIRKCVAFALVHNHTWLNQLIWREFFMQILYHFPKLVKHSFNTKYDTIIWRNQEEEFEKWCEGRTGYPIVDAGMRQLNQTGYMHNRVRMLVASFLCKHLLIDWRWGEAYFAQKLNDFDLSANNGNWQWASGSGCDAAPYFRVFNPSLQAKKFDNNAVYIQQWLPEYGTEHYPQPIVEHSFARERALKVYRSAIKENQLKTYKPPPY